MRLIGTLNDQSKMNRFSLFLQEKHIPHHFEIETDNHWESPDYGLAKFHLWIEEEDHIAEVLEWYKKFQLNPEDPLFILSSENGAPFPKQSQNEHSLKNKSNPWNKQPMGIITRLLLGTCVFLFFFGGWVTPPLNAPEKYSHLTLFTSPVDKALLFDYPKFYELLNRFLLHYGFNELEETDQLPPAGKKLLQQINHTPFWPGYYHLLLTEGFKGVEEGFSKYPTFEKIKSGQLWRLFTPCLLHGDLFHLFFNMLWLIVLTKQIEQRLGPLRILIFIVIVAVISNTAQYLMSGPNFIGFSGVLVGMLAFIWKRQRIAAWEGYQMDTSTYLFMLIFILSMAGIQFFSFFLEKAFELPISPNIANMAHLIGGFTGYFLGRMNYFSWRHD